jgi:cardiolipin synthase
LSWNWATEPAAVGWAIFFFDLFLRLLFGARILRRKLPAGVAWAWLFLLLFLPVFGTVLYLFLGEYRQSGRRQRRLDTAVNNMGRLARQKVGTTEVRTDLSGFIESLIGLPPFVGNDIDLLRNADEGFTQLLIDIRAAQRSLEMEFFIWCDGGRADEVALAVADAAKRGVKCRVLVDAIGSRGFIRGPHFQKMREAGVEMLVALPSGFWRSLFARPDLRIHRKIVVIDRAIAYTGSMNLADPKLFKISAGVGQWVDALARIRGPAVAALYGVFLTDWCAERGGDFETEIRSSPWQDLAVGKSAVVQCIPSGPAVKDSAIEQILIMAIYSAKTSLTLTTPYFVPSEALSYALVAAARRGVKTTLIVPEKVDSHLTHYASRSFLQDLINVGVEVALYRPGLLHTKSVTIDGEWCLFGSLNLDPRSLRINFEITVAVYEAAFTAAVAELQADYLKQSKLLTAGDIAAIPGLERWKQDLARLLGPLL